MSFYRVARVIARPFCKGLFRYSAVGKENIPDRPFIIVSNHVAYRDAVCIALCVKDEISFLAKAELFEKKILGLFLKAFKMIPIKRAQADLSAIRESMKVLKSGGIVGVFPQGTRVKDRLPAAEQALGGSALIASMSKAVVLPVAVVYKNNRPKLFSKMKVVFGEPVSYEEYSKIEDRDEIGRFLFGHVCRLVEEHTF